MASDKLLKPTLHVEVVIQGIDLVPRLQRSICEAVTERLVEVYTAVHVGQQLTAFDVIENGEFIKSVEVADYTGPKNSTGLYNPAELLLGVQAYVLCQESEPNRRLGSNRPYADEIQTTRILALPNVALHDEWNSLVYDDALAATLLRCLVRMVSIMSSPDLNLSKFNWNRLCLLHGPPGGGKSTLCRALAQKLSIRLRNVFPSAGLVEISTNSMLSKWFGESGKLVSEAFERVHGIAQNRQMLVCVVIDEIESIAGSRQKSTAGKECQDSLRATNELLTALDDIRNLPNVIVLCTSNLIEAIDAAFLDRVDLQEYIPTPSSAAIYNIFRSGLNEMSRTGIISAAEDDITSTSNSSSTEVSSPHKPVTRSSGLTATLLSTTDTSAPEQWTVVSVPSVPTFERMQVQTKTQPSSLACRVWRLAQQCQGFSGRTLRRLPLLGLARYTWGGNCSLDEAVAALSAAVEEQLKGANMAQP